MAVIYDNINQKFVEGLRATISNQGVNRVDFCVGYFNLRGWKCIYDLVENLPGDYVYETKGDDEEEQFRYCRLLIGMQKADEELFQDFYSPYGMPKMSSERVQMSKRELVEDFKNQITYGVPTKEDEKALQMLLEQLKAGKVVVKLYLKNQLHAKLYLAYRPIDKSQPILSLLGSSNLTFAGLKGQEELDTEIPDRDNAKTLADWFEDRWNEKYCIDITSELIKVIEESWACKIATPYQIYLKTAYHLSREARESISEYNLPDVFSKELFDFQQTAVKVAARHIEKRGGAMIGDVVGLGKTISACAVAKVYEMQHACSTLILCPRNLVDMWEDYVRRYDLKADVMSVAKSFDEKKMRFYRLVIIDESHNLRNTNGKRYKNIKSLIDYQGCKVLLLTATPYNKDYRDLSSQLRLFIAEDTDLGIMPEAYIKKLGGKQEFSVKHSDTFLRSITAFEHSNESEDWQSLMRMFLVRRTRTFIKNNYAYTDETNGRKYLLLNDGTHSYFPERQAKSVKFDVNEQFARLYSEDMLDKLSSLKLPRYELGRYIDKNIKDDVSEEKKQIFANLAAAGNSMIGFCRSMFMKRLDSSGMSFLISVYRHILRNAIFIYALNNGLPLPIGDTGEMRDNYDEGDSDTDDFFDSEESKPLSKNFPTELKEYLKQAEKYYHIIPFEKKSIKSLPADYFTDSLKTALKKDSDILISMLSLCGEWKAREDKKIDALQSLITEKHKEDKVLVFTQFTDTAEYVAEELKNRGLEKYGKIACVTGDTENITNIVSRFSPESNKAEIAEKDDLRVLIATDVLSEGQNLQDCHVIINYDLPWAIIRLIQRAGRVDRIGQKAEQIQCYSFFPAEGIDKIIHLRTRLNERINQNAKVVGSDEIFFEGNEKNLKDLYNEKTGILDEEDDGDVDLASAAFQIWTNAVKKDKSLEKTIPALTNLLYCAKPSKTDFKKAKSVSKESRTAQSNGVITYARTKEGNDMLFWLDEKGEAVTMSQKTILDAMACDENEKNVPTLPNHHELVEKSVKLINEYSSKTNSGILGSRFSTKYQLYTRLKTYCDENEGTLFIPHNLRTAIDDIYNYTLKEKARDTLSLLLRRGASINTIAELVVEYKDNDELVIKKLDELENRPPQIICSMGVIAAKS